MRHVVKASTDAGALLLFDPGALPADFDRLSLDDPREVIPRLNLTGLACGIALDSDGDQLMHIYIDEPIPEELWEYANDPNTILDFQVPTGRLILSGWEFVVVEVMPRSSKIRRLSEARQRFNPDSIGLRSTAPGFPDR